MNGTKTSWLGIAGVLFFVSATVAGGLLLPGYSHISQLISESYAIDTPYGIQLRYFGFLPAGVFIAVFALFAARILSNSFVTTAAFAGIGIFYGVATIIVSLFPCDKGCNKEFVDPSLSQLIHNLTGVLTYMVVPLSLLALGIVAQKWKNGKTVSYAGIICGLTAILFVGILSSDPYSPVAGLYQRIVEGSVLVWILVCSFYLRSPARSAV